MRSARVVVSAFVVCIALAVDAGAQNPTLLHRAIQHCLDGRPAKALDIVENLEEGPALEPGQGREELAALWNLGARILYERYQGTRTLHPRDVHPDWRTATAFAAAAVWEYPYDLDYWRDYVRIAGEGMSLEEFGRRWSNHPFSYRLNTGRAFVLTESGELRRVGFAVTREMAGRVDDAGQVLENWLSVRRNRTHCAAVAVLADLNFELDRFASAKSSLEDYLPRCPEAENTYARRIARIERVMPQEQSAKVVRIGTSITVEAPYDDEHPFDVVNRILRDPERIDEWYRLWDRIGNDEAFSQCYDQLLRVVRNRPGAADKPAVVRAEAYRLIEQGKFGSARERLDRLIVDSAGDADADLLVGTVLLDADPDLPLNPTASSRLRAARRADPYLVACIDEKALALCLNKKRKCSSLAIVCEESEEFIFTVWKEGIANRPHAVKDVHNFVRPVVQLTKEMIRDTEARLRAEIRSTQEGFERRIASLSAYVDVIVEGPLKEHEAKLRAMGKSVSEIREEMEIKDAALRREVQIGFERTAADAQRTRNEAAATRALTIEQGRKLTHLAASLETVEALRAEIPQLLQQERARVQPVIDQLIAASGQLQASVVELQRPEFARHWTVLRTWKKRTPEEVANSLLFVTKELGEAIIFPARGAAKLIVNGPAIAKAVSDFLLDARQKRDRARLEREQRKKAR